MSMLSDDERHELSLLLPWYANGTLDEESTRRIDAALAEDDALAREFDLVLEDQAAVVDLVSEEEVPASIGERFKAALTAEQTGRVVHDLPQNAGQSMVSRILSALFPAQPRAYAAVAAGVALLVPAVAILSYDAGTQRPAQYQTASGEEGATSDQIRLLVKFRPAIAWSEVDAFLKENAGQITKGPSADGLYELEFDKVDGLAARLGAETEVFEFALPAN